MKINGKIRIWIAGLLLIMTAGMTGCGSKPAKFTSQDGTASITLTTEWEEQQTQKEGWLGAIKDHKESLVVVQMVKSDGGRLDTEAVKQLLESQYQVESLEGVEQPAVPAGLTRVQAFTFQGKAEDVDIEGYWAYGQTVYAFYSFVYVAEHIDEDALEEIQKAWGSLEENAPEIENHSREKVTDTVLWMNGTHAVLTVLNDGDYNMFGGGPANDDTKEQRQKVLKENWGITDKASAEETLQWLAEEGHHTAYAADMELLEKNGLTDIAEADRAACIYEKYELTEEEAQVYADLYAGYEKNGADAVRAWDDSRAMSVVADSYMAGYYTETEALDKSLEIAGRIQSAYSSWDAFLDSYLLGCEYHMGEECTERRSVSEEVKGESGNPYLLDWNLTLEKSW